MTNHCNVQRQASFGRVQAILLSVLIVLWPLGIRAERIAYQTFSSKRIQGTWEDSDDGLFHISPDEEAIDFNRDGVDDIAFRHTHVRREDRIDSDAVKMLRIADAGIQDATRILRGLRILTIEAATSRVNDGVAVARLQEQLERGLQAIRETAFDSKYDGTNLLDGSSGIKAFPPDTGRYSAFANLATVPGEYPIEITQAAKRAVVPAETVQTSPLDSGEVIIINGVTIELEAGMSQRQVVDRINEFSDQTRAIADIGTDLRTRLLSPAYGNSAKVDVVTNRVATGQSSGFGVARREQIGTNIEVMIEGTTYAGNGGSVVATSGPEKGMVLRFDLEPQEIATPVGPVGTVRVEDLSPTFAINSEPPTTKSISLPNMNPAALAVDDTDNMYESLDEIQLLTSTQAGDAIAIIDRAYDQFVADGFRVSDFLALNGLPYGEGSLQTLGNAEFLVGKDGGLLPAGIVIGPQQDFQDGLAWIQDSRVFQELKQAGFVGVRVPMEASYQYGWIGVQVDKDSSWRITDAAWNTTPDAPVVSAVIPEPNFTSSGWGIGLMLICGRWRCRRNIGSSHYQPMRD